MYLTKKEMDALQEAIDFIRTNADGAADYSPFQEMQTNLNSIWKKAKQEHYNRYKRQLVKKYLKKAIKTTKP